MCDIDLHIKHMIHKLLQHMYKLILYRRHSDNASNTGSTSDRKYLLRIKERVSLIKNLIIR